MISKVNSINFTGFQKEVENTGETVSNAIKTNVQKFDTFVTGNKKAQLVIGASSIAAVVTLSILCVKRMLDKLKEVKEEK